MNLSLATRTVKRNGTLSFSKLLMILSFLLLGGSNIHNGKISLGTSVYGATATNKRSVKAKSNHKISVLRRFVLKRLARLDGFGGMERIVKILLIVAGILAILFGIWAVSLLAAGEAFGLVIGFLSLVCLAFLIIVGFNI